MTPSALEIIMMPLKAFSGIIKKSFGSKNKKNIVRNQSVSKY